MRCSSRTSTSGAMPARPAGLPAELDDFIEAALEKRLGVQVDFEIDDAMSKLKPVGLVNETDGRFRAMPMDSAQARLDHLWDRYARQGDATRP